MEEQQVNESKPVDQAPEAPKAKLKKVELIAVVRYQLADEPGFVHAQTKKELSKKLQDPSINSILAVIRGRKLDICEKRNVTFA